MTAGFTIAEQIACVKREIAMRKRVYPRWVAAKKMDEEKSKLEIACMESILRRLEDIQATIRKFEGP